MNSNKNKIENGYIFAVIEHRLAQNKFTPRGFLHLTLSVHRYLVYICIYLECIIIIIMIKLLHSSAFHIFDFLFIGIILNIPNERNVCCSPIENIMCTLYTVQVYSMYTGVKSLKAHTHVHTLTQTHTHTHTKNETELVYVNLYACASIPSHVTSIRLFYAHISH